MGVRTSCGLDHELGDVGEQSALAEIDLFERDRREELGEDAVDVGGSFGFGAGSGQGGGETIGLGGLLGLSRVMLAEGRMRRGDVHAAATVQGVEMGAARIGCDDESGVRHLRPRRMEEDDVNEVEDVKERSRRSGELRKRRKADPSLRSG